MTIKLKDKSHPIYKLTCLWCNDYYHMRWTWLPKFKSWMSLFAFHIAIISLGKAWIQLFFLQLWIKIGQTGLFYPSIATSLEERKLWIQTSCRPGEGWASPNYSCPRHTTYVSSPWAKLVYRTCEYCIWWQIKHFFWRKKYFK